MFGNFAKLDSPRRLVQFWQNLQTSLVLLIPNCTRQRMITYTNTPKFHDINNFAKKRRTKKSAKREKKTRGAKKRREVRKKGASRQVKPRGATISLSP